MPSVLQGDFSELLGQDEREYRKEKVRIASFSEYTGPVSVLEFARLGFYFKAQQNEIECFSCHKSFNVVRLRQIREGYLGQSQVHYPNCSWRSSDENVPSYSRTTVDLRGEHALRFIREKAVEIRRRDNGNLECHNISDERLDGAIYHKPGSLEMAPTGSCPCQICTPNETIPFCLYVREPNQITVSRAGLARLAERNLERTGIACPEHGRLERRMESFEMDQHWARKQLAPVSVFAEAGFYFKGPEDNVECFHCGGSLRDWDPRACPWREHARWFPWCPYLRQEKGDRFIHDILMVTKKIRDRHDDRHPVMESEPIRNAIQMGYSPDRISREILTFFKETGFYPGQDALMERLEY